MTHPCIRLYQLHGAGFSIGSTAGICRITGEKSKGQIFSKWVKDTFTDHHCLKPGDIISNEAAFCFVEDSTVIQAKTGRDKPQKFRTYSHILTTSGDWLCMTKADKKAIAALVSAGEIEIICLTDSGQKHVFFKHRPGFWQLDESFILPDVPEFSRLHTRMQELQALGFGQEQIKSGKYYHAQIIKAGVERWRAIESQIEAQRGTPIFDFAAWLMYQLNDNIEP